MMNRIKVKVDNAKKLRLTTVLKPDAYEVRIKKIGSNLYQDISTRIIIKTRACIEPAGGNESVLDWTGSPQANSISKKRTSHVSSKKFINDNETSRKRALRSLKRKLNYPRAVPADQRKQSPVFGSPSPHQAHSIPGAVRPARTLAVVASTRPKVSRRTPPDSPRAAVGCSRRDSNHRSRGSAR